MQINFFEQMQVDQDSSQDPMKQQRYQLQWLVKNKVFDVTVQKDADELAALYTTIMNSKTEGGKAGLMVFSRENLIKDGVLKIYVCWGEWQLLEAKKNEQAST